MSGKWYFIIYESQYRSKSTNTVQSWTMGEEITQEHPIDFLARMRKDYAESNHARYNYRIKFWSEIPEDVALKHKKLETFD